MQESVYERIHKTLSWKRIVGFNLILFLVLIVPISVRLAQQDTENRSGAAGEIAPPIVTPPPSYPAAPPKIERVATFFGKPGDTIVVIGSNFGDYQWASRLYVGAVEANKDAIVRWTNTVIEVKIPDSARTGLVSIAVNGHESKWEGSLLLYDVARSAQIGITKASSGVAELFVTNASMLSRGMIELSYLSEPVTITASSSVVITEQTNTADSLGKKMRIQFNVVAPISSSQTNLLSVSYPGIGTIEILRAELYDQSQNLISVYADPLDLKTLP